MDRLTLMIVILGLLGACSQPVQTTDQVDDHKADLIMEVSSEIEALDLVQVEMPDWQADTDPVDQIADTDSETEDTGPACLPGEGCFLDPCVDNSDCQSGWCVQHRGEGVCSQSCQEECPPGWSCRQVAGTDPDIVFICVSDFANLCRPCAKGDDCTSTGGSLDACLDYGAEGSFCGSPCGEEDTCPWGFSCQEVETVDGVSLKQCTADAGVCPCTGDSIAKGLWTPCQLTNEAGTCTGQRVCLETGLSDCDAVMPVAETCNGVDDNCDGDTDEPPVENGEFLNLCDDGNQCTDDICTGEEGCTNLPMETGSCDDGDPCTAADHCADGTCLGTPVECNDSNPCTDDFCTVTGGCDFIPNNEDCDDEDPCTVADECNEGICAGTAVPCDCEVDSDCGDLEDGNLCNGTLYCNLETLPYKCALVPDSVIVCPEASGTDAPCLTPACNPDTGECSQDAANDATPCINQDLCTLNDYCENGTCTDGVTINCNDGNPCTDDTCDPGIGCLNTPTSMTCNDGDACTTGDTCSQGQCTGGAAPDCNDDNPCTDDACSPDSGCTHTPNQESCEDGNACTKGDFCSAGVCQAGNSTDCDDKNVCTEDSCSVQVGCINTPGEGSCSDGNPCTLNDFCKDSSCQSGALVDCDDKNPCTDDSCDELGLCVHTANLETCDDGNACTIGDHCADGKCLYDGLTVCNDQDICTDDLCDPILGCTSKLNQAPCDDDDACTTVDACLLGTCTGGPAVTCNDNNSCTDDTCSPDTGCVFTPNQEMCDDANACTETDQCHSGWCGGTPLDCDDGDICTDDSCSSQTGCLHTHNQAPCNDGDLCTINDACLNGICIGGMTMPCDDGDFCNGEETCNPDTGCVGGLVPTVDDDIDCTDDACNSQAQEVTHTPNHDLCPLPGLCESSICDPEQGCLLTTLDDCCGNMITEDGEECDDANLVDTDACVECQNATCGDGALHAGQEVCDADLMTLTTCEEFLGAGFSGDLDCDNCEFDVSGCTGPLGSEDNPAADCKAIFDAGLADGDGVYYLANGEDSIKAWCDMANGGWTLVTSWPYTKTPGVWGAFSLDLDDPAPGTKHAIPFRTIFPHPSKARMTYLGNDQTLTFDIKPASDWTTLDEGCRIQLTDNRYFIFEEVHDSSGQGICINNGAYSGGHNCDGDAGQVAGQGLFNKATQNEFCNCGSFGWKYSSGGCNATICSPPGQVAIYLQ